jgi:uncharacterized membrane protein
MLYVVPGWVRRGETVVAVNVGGAVIPTGLSAFLMFDQKLGWAALAAAAIVAVPVHAGARLVQGVGVVVPALLPPVAAVLVAWATGADSVSAVAYVAGTLGTLVGADLLNLHRIRGLDAPVVSIGGAGTFDAIFVTGIVAALVTAA